MSNQFDRDFFHKLMIVASNDINENVLQELKKQEVRESRTRNRNITKNRLLLSVSTHPRYVATYF